MRPASASLLRPSACSIRSTVTNWSPALVAICSAWSTTRASAAAICGWVAPEPETLGILPSAASVACSACLGLPPARAIRPLASPSGSSSSTFSRCSGVICGLPSRTASVWADWRNPLRRSESFSKSMGLALAWDEAGECGGTGRYSASTLNGRSSTLNGRYSAASRKPKGGGRPALMRRTACGQTTPENPRAALEPRGAPRYDFPGRAMRFTAEGCKPHGEVCD